MMNFNYNETEKILTCLFSGRLDTIASIDLGNEIDGKISALKGTDDPKVKLEGKIVFDLEGVNYIASSFIRICVSSARQVSNGNFSIINCEPFIKKTLKIAGLDDLLNVS